MVDADPLADVQNLKKLALVVKEGKTVDVASLPTNPILTSDEAKKSGAVRTR